MKFLKNGLVRTRESSLLVIVLIVIGSAQAQAAEKTYLCQLTTPNDHTWKDHKKITLIGDVERMGSIKLIFNATTAYLGEHSWPYEEAVRYRRVRYYDQKTFAVGSIVHWGLSAKYDLSGLNIIEGRNVHAYCCKEE